MQLNRQESNTSQPWIRYSGPNMGYVQEQYERYAADPEAVDKSFRELFRLWGEPPQAIEPATATGASPQVQAQQGTVSKELLKKVVAADKLVWNIRTFGHLAANIDPLGLWRSADTRLLEPETYGLNEQDLKAIEAALIWENAPADVLTGWEAFKKLRELYTRSIGYEFSHVHEEEERNWLNAKVESGQLSSPLSAEDRKQLLLRLIQVEQFEAFLHRTFIGQKRFSIEGVDMLVPVMDEIVRSVASQGASHVLMGMAHRGRLNVLAHVLGKAYGHIFSEFHHSAMKEMIPSEGSMGINFGWTGDVKYHLGAHRSMQQGESVNVRVTLANNPSHLEFVNPVVEGFTRAAQEDRSKPGMPVQDINKAVAILVHGDAAFPGEGIVAETLNFNALKGFRNGGTIHIIANNRLGFTTESSDSRSTHYASDLAKGFEIPIVHVNADDPDACIAAVRLASEYRIKFKKDFVIDLVGYRRYGHNEMDDPDVTQPIVYRKVREHPTVATAYSRRLVEEGCITEAESKQLLDSVLNELQEAYDQVKQKDNSPLSFPIFPLTGKEEPRTAVALEVLREINAELLRWPEGFNVYGKLQRILQRRATVLNDGEKVDWATAEVLAFATILADGRPIRMTGQDSERGTFAHRHLVLHDAEDGKTYTPLHHLPQANASLAIHNSPLSETAVLGFEYGYNVHAPETLVIWEAQYGDFSNVAQVIFDQFISSGRAKWSQQSSLVMLLPHSYEGQGPEHSSARLERFLQLAAEDNWMVANLSSAAQYFHLLRRQAAIANTPDARPLVLMAPKSLIRNPRAASPAIELSEGGFQPVWDRPEEKQKRKDVRRLVLSSGKISLDLEEAKASQQDADWSWLHIARIEQLYPFPEQDIVAVIQRYPQLKEIVWLQEEPHNMGAWFYMEPRLRAIAPAGVSVSYVGRPERSSPASGYQNVYQFEQQHIVTMALNNDSFNKVLSGR